MNAIEFEKFREIYLGYAEICLRGSEIFKKAAVFEKTIKKFWKTSEILIENGKKYNLTSILEPEEIIRKHIIDSILPFCLIYDGFLKNITGSIADVGTGAGFPLLPLAAVYSELDSRMEFLGIDSTGKKIKHIREAAEFAGLYNVKAAQGRAEELGVSALRESQGLVTARAVASLPVILELCVPLVKKGGLFVALKSRLEEERDMADGVAEELGAKEELTVEYSLPGGDKRTVLVYRKAAETPDRYPRRYSEIVRKTK